MKVKFLGTTHGVPQPDRNYQSILIETKDGAYLFDVGAPVMELLIKDGYDLNKIKAIFITHRHGDHIMGLNNIVSLSTWYYKEMRFDMYMPEQEIIGMTKAYNSFLNPKFENDRITYNLFSEGMFFDNGDIKVTAVRTHHMDISCGFLSYGFLVEAEGKRVYITGDMNRFLNEFPTELLSEPTDVLISECAHCTAELLIEKIEETSVKKVMIVHVNPAAKYDTLKEYAKSAPIEYLFPNDLDEYII